jgi:hypothetical protein
MKPTLTQRLAALAVALIATSSIVLAHASLAYPAVAPAALVLAQACSR